MRWVRDHGGHPSEDVGAIVDAISTAGGTPLVVAERVDGQARPGAGRDPPQGRRQGRACASGSTSCAAWASAR